MILNLLCNAAGSLQYRDAEFSLIQCQPCTNSLSVLLARL